MVRPYFQGQLTAPQRWSPMLDPNHVKKSNSKTMHNTKLITVLLTLSLVVAAATAQAKSPNSATRVENLIWANGKIYDTIVSGSTFNSPPDHSVDLFFDFGMSGLMDQRPVSDAAPGDKEYNGGRWWVQKVFFTAQGIAALVSCNT